MLILAPLLRYLSIRMRAILGLLLLVVGLVLIFAPGTLALATLGTITTLATIGAVLALLGLILVVSALVRRPRPVR